MINKTGITIVVGILLIIGFSISAFSQDLPEVLRRAVENDTAYNKLSCKLKIELDVPGLHMPDKEIDLVLEKGKKPKIKSKGLILLPKRGLIGQYRDLFKRPSQAIPLESSGDTVSYKLVSMDNKTDWVTIDFKLTETDARVHSQIISTRKNGVYEISHQYNDNKHVFPSLSVIKFEAMPVKLPLKFIGKSSDTDHLFNGDGPIDGKVYLHYSEMVVE